MCYLWRSSLVKPGFLWIKEIWIKSLIYYLSVQTHSSQRTGSSPWGTSSPNFCSHKCQRSSLCKVQILMWSCHRNLTAYALKQKRAAQGQRLEKNAVVIYALLHCRLLWFCHLPLQKHWLVPGPDGPASSFAVLKSFCLRWNLQLGGMAHELVHKANFGTKQRQEHLLPSRTSCWPSSVTGECQAAELLSHLSGLAGRAHVN